MSLTPHSPRSDLPLPEKVPSPTTTTTIEIKGTNADLVKELREASAEPQMRLALEALCEESQRVIKLVPKRIDRCELRVQEQAVVIEHPDKIKKIPPILEGMRQEIFKKALVYRSLSALRGFAHARALTDTTVEELKILGERVAGRLLHTDEEIRHVIATTRDGARQELEDLRKRLIKKLDDVSPSQFLHEKSPRDYFRRLGRTVHRLVALSLFVEPPSRGPHRFGDDEKESAGRWEVREKVCSAVSIVSEQLALRWTRELFAGDEQAANETCRLRVALQENLQADGFNAPLPPVFPGAPGSANHSRSLLSLRSSESWEEPFPPIGDGAAALNIQRASAMLSYDAELRRRPLGHDQEESLDILRERLLDLVPKLPSAIRAWRNTLPIELPKQLHQFLDTLCLLRFHGGDEGLAIFASLACMMDDKEGVKLSSLHRVLADAKGHGDKRAEEKAIEDLKEFFRSRVEEHSVDYAALVELVASWSIGRTQDQRDDMASHWSDRLQSISVRAIYTLAAGLLHSQEESLRKGMHVRIDVLRALRRDWWALREAARESENPRLVEQVENCSMAGRAIIIALEIKRGSSLARAEQLGLLDRLIAYQERVVIPDRALQPHNDSALRHMIELRSRIQEYSRLTPEQLIEKVASYGTSGEISGAVEVLEWAIHSLSHLRDRSEVARCETALKDALRVVVDSAIDNWVTELQETAIKIDSAPHGFEGIGELVDLYDRKREELEVLQAIVERGGFPQGSQWKEEFIDIASAYESDIISTLEARQERFRQFITTANERRSSTESGEGISIGHIALLKSLLSPAEGRGESHESLYRIALEVNPTLFT